MLKSILLFHQYLIVDLILLEIDLPFDYVDHLVHVLVLAHAFAVYLLAFLEDLLEFGLVSVLYGVFVVFRPIGQVTLFVLSRKGLGLASLRSVKRVEGTVADSDVGLRDASIQELGRFVEDGVDIFEVIRSVVF